jgi:hypothetical protein
MYPAGISCTVRTRLAGCPNQLGVRAKETSWQVAPTKAKNIRTNCVRLNAFAFLQ